MPGASSRHVSQKGDQNQNIRGFSPLTTDRRLTSSPVAASNISMSGTSSEIAVAGGGAVVVVAGIAVVVTATSVVVVVSAATVVVVEVVVVVVVVAGGAVVVVEGSVVAAVSSEASVAAVDVVAAAVVVVGLRLGRSGGRSGRLGRSRHGRRRIHRRWWSARPEPGWCRRTCPHPRVPEWWQDRWCLRRKT